MTECWNESSRLKDVGLAWVPASVEVLETLLSDQLTYVELICSRGLKP
jgi:hypothetical protein